MWQKPTKNKESSMNDNEIGNPPIKALIVFRENGDTDNLFVPILYDAIRTTGIDVRCSTNEFWNSDTPYDIIHFQWPEEVMEGNCDDPDRICRLKECIAFFRSRGARFVYTRHNVRPHDANEVIGRAYDITVSTNLQPNTRTAGMSSFLILFISTHTRRTSAWNVRASILICRRRRLSSRRSESSGIVKRGGW